MDNIIQDAPPAGGPATEYQPAAGRLAGLYSFAERQGASRVLLYSTLLSVALAFAAYTFVVVPGFEVYGYKLIPGSQTNQERADALVKVLEQNEKNRALERTKPEFEEELRRDVTLYREALPLLPNDPEGSNVLAFMQFAAERNGVTLNAFNNLSPLEKKAAKAAPAAGLSSREMPAVAIGTLPQIRRFFESVERLPRIVLIKEFAATSLGQRVMVSFTLVAYNAPRPDQIPALPPDLQELLAQPLEEQFVPALNSRPASADEPLPATGRRPLREGTTD